MGKFEKSTADSLCYLENENTCNYESKINEKSSQKNPPKCKNLKKSKFSDTSFCHVTAEVSFGLFKLLGGKEKRVGRAGQNHTELNHHCFSFFAFIVKQECLTDARTIKASTFQWLLTFCAVFLIRPFNG